MFHSNTFDLVLQRNYVNPSFSRANIQLFREKAKKHYQEESIAKLCKAVVFHDEEIATDSKAVKSLNEFSKEERERVERERIAMLRLQHTQHVAKVQQLRLQKLRTPAKQCKILQHTFDEQRDSTPTGPPGGLAFA